MVLAELNVNGNQDLKFIVSDIEWENNNGSRYIASVVVNIDNKVFKSFELTFLFKQLIIHIASF